MKILFFFLLLNSIINFADNDSTISLDSNKIYNKGNNELKEESNNPKNDGNDFSNWGVFINFISNPFTSAALASIITLILTNFYKNRLKKKEEINNYKVLLLSTKNELEFYISKLKQLDNESLSIIHNIRINEKPIIPTYSLYPKYLEDAKIRINIFFKNADIVKRISHCHFELSHLSERLELMKKELRTDYDSDIEISNVGGLNKLESSNIREFTDVIEELSSEINKYK